MSFDHLSIKKDHAYPRPRYNVFAALFVNVRRLMEQLEGLTLKLGRSDLYGTSQDTANILLAVSLQLTEI